MFDPVSNKVDFAKMEEDVLRYWEKDQIFQRSLDERKGCKEFVFYDGPPFATGSPHYGHLLAGTIKDIAPRYQTMRGHYVERRFGWDCHGLPIEALAQEKLGLSGAADIMAHGVDAFNETCRSMVLTYVEEWRKTVTRMGRWVDFDNDYKTMDVTFMESIWWVFKQLWDQCRVYKSHRIMPYSWKLNTPLSNFEAGSNYQEVQDPSITVRVKLNQLPLGLGARDLPVYALIWTTTPWTLYGNLALCAGPDIDYVAVRDGAEGKIYLLAAARLPAYYKKPEDYEVLGSWKGADLVDLSYQPIFPTFAGTPNCFRILNDNFVSTDDGTGLVHMAPAFGEDDFRICKAAGIPLLDYLDDACAFNDTVPEYQGVFCKDADKAIIRSLKDSGQLIHQSTLVHSYPFCPRTDTPLIYRAIEAWYVRVEDLHERLVANNDTVHWVPAVLGEKRFGNWLKEAKDWNISRNRFWGSCIPIWVSEDGSDMICIGSIDELEKYSGERLTDLHKHFVDKVIFEFKGKVYRRTPEVLDCWFESGAMPYAQHHYPFKRADELDCFFPADFIAEGLDQTRGWFYTLMLLGTAIFDRSPYKNVIINGLVLAEDGRKMSKRLKNYPDPVEVINTYGADALRLYMINSPIVRAEDLCFSEEGVKHSLRHLLIPWWNAYSFFVTYANIDGWTPDKQPVGARRVATHLLDRWILSAMERLTHDVVTGMDAYDLQSAVRPFVRFVEDLTNWYIRRSRRRFWKSTDDADKAEAYATLYEVLIRLSTIAAPFVPFISESIYRNLRRSDAPESVHLCDFPMPDDSRRDLDLEKQMETVMSIVGMGRQLRANYNVKVRQPLRGIHVVSREGGLIDQMGAFADMIRDELNVREIWISQDESQLAHFAVKPNFSRLGPKLGPRMKQIVGPVKALGPEAALAFLNGESVSVTMPDGEGMALTPDDVIIDRLPKEGLAVQTEGALVVALDLELTDELVAEGLAREFVNKVQNMRKTADFEVTQRIHIRYVGDAEVQAAVTRHAEYIATETLSRSCTHTDAVEKGTDWDLNGHAVVIELRTV